MGDEEGSEREGVSKKNLKNWRRRREVREKEN
jgi:hypothetical protein